MKRKLLNLFFCIALGVFLCFSSFVAHADESFDFSGMDSDFYNKMLYEFDGYGERYEYLPSLPSFEQYKENHIYYDQHMARYTVLYRFDFVEYVEYHGYKHIVGEWVPNNWAHRRPDTYRNGVFDPEDIDQMKKWMKEVTHINIMEYPDPATLKGVQYFPNLTCITTWAGLLEDLTVLDASKYA